VKDIFAFKFYLTQDGNSFASPSIFFFLDVNHQTRNRIHQSRLPGAVGAENTHHLFFMDLQAEVVDGQGIFEKTMRFFISSISALVLAPQVSCFDRLVLHHLTGRAIGNLGAKI